MKILRRKYLYITLVLLSFAGLYAYAPYFVVEMKNPVILTAKHYFHKDVNNYQTHFPEYAEKIHFKTRDNITLTASIFKSKKKTAKANIILLHGIRSSKESFLPVIDFLTQNNFNAIALDLRAHGESGGEFCTFGYLEKQDVKRLIDCLIKTKNLKAPFGIWGHSLGGAIALQTLATDKNIKFGIIESSYSNFKSITADYSDYYLGFDMDFLNKNILERSGELAKFDINKVNPIDYCKKISQPVLLIHGTDDKKINIKYAYDNYKALKSYSKYFYKVKGAGHNDVWQKGGQPLFDKILEFLQEQK